MAKLTFYKNGKVCRSGLEVSIHWEGHNTWTGRGHTKLRTDSNGTVFVNDDLIRSGGSVPDKIWIDNPDGGSTLYYIDLLLRRGEDYEFQIEGAHRQ